MVSDFPLTMTVSLSSDQDPFESGLSDYSMRTTKDYFLVLMDHKLYIHL
jgi:hypothetical protein